MAKISDLRTFIPELWSEQIIKEFKFNLGKRGILNRSKGERLLRAAAKGASPEELAKIEHESDYLTAGELYDYIQSTFAEDAAAMRSSINASIMGDMSTGPRKE